MMPLPILAIDPGGSDGGAVLLDSDGRTVLFAGSWHRVQRNGQDAWIVVTVVDGFPALETVATSMHGVGVQVVVGAYLSRSQWRLVVEGLFGRAFTLERLSWYSGLVAGPCLAGTVGDVLRPKASTWRPAVLKIPPRAESDVADAAALAFVTKAVTGLGVLASNPHVAEAACMAVYAHRMQPWNDKGELPTRKRPKRMKAATKPRRKRRAA
jgi:hypothetical protein